MPYADTDFFIALLDDSDRLNVSARAVYVKYKGEIYTSLATILEVLIVTKRFNAPPGETINYVLSIANVVDIDPLVILLAVSYIERQKLSIFDAFHAAMCGNEIISSDHTYDKLGIKRIKL